jgi:hypothetical protein
MTDRFTIEPQPVRRRPPVCTACGGDEIFEGEFRDPLTGRCEHCADVVISVRQWFGVLLVIFIAMVVIAVVGWVSIPAPRSTPDPTPVGSGDASRDARPANRVDMSAVEGSSGPESSGAPGTVPASLGRVWREGFPPVTMPGQGLVTDPGAPSETSATLSPSLGETGGSSAVALVPDERGWATWCAPKGRYCQGWDTRYVGAVPSFRWGDDPYWVQVCRLDAPATCTQVLVVSYCGCGDRRGRPTVIDLSVPAFGELAPHGDGVVLVTVERIDGAPNGPTLPPTSTED